MFFLGKWLANFVVLAIVSLIYKGLTYANLTAMIWCFGTHAGSAYHKTHIDLAYVAHKHTDLGVIQFSHKRSDYLANGINSPRYLFEILWSSHHSLDPR